MDHYDIISGKFHRTIESITMSVDDLAEPIESASALLSECLLADGKIIACGNGADGALAQIFVSQLLARHEQERPALPALALSADSTSLGAITVSNGYDEIFGRQLRALGSAGDVLVCINSSPQVDNLLHAVQCAQQGNMRVILLSNGVENELVSLARGDDVVLGTSLRQSADSLELHLVVLHCLCALLDHNLFGSYHPE